MRAQERLMHFDESWMVTTLHQCNVAWALSGNFHPRILFYFFCIVCLTLGSVVVIVRWVLHTRRKRSKTRESAQSHCRAAVPGAAYIWCAAGMCSKGIPRGFLYARCFCCNYRPYRILDTAGQSRGGNRQELWQSDSRTLNFGSGVLWAPCPGEHSWKPLPPPGGSWLQGQQRGLS